MQHTDPRDFAPLHPLTEHLSPDEYLALLHPKGCHGRPAYLAFPDGKSWIHKVVSRELLLAQFSVFLDASVYVALNRFRSKRGISDLAALNAIYVDLDYFNTLAWRGRPAQEVQAAYARHLRENGIAQPSVFVESGRGLYAIWLIKEMPRQAEPRWRAAQTALISKSLGFGVDRSCVDAARVFRIPGSLNEKSGRTVRISGGTLIRYNFDTVSDDIYRACGRPTRAEYQELKAARKPSDPSRPTTTMPRGLPQHERHRLILHDLDTYRSHLGGRIPEGQRNLFLHLFATCLTHIPGETDIEAEILRMADMAMPDLPASEVEGVIRQAQRKARHPDSQTPSHEVRYKYRGATMADRLGITDELARVLSLKQVVPQSERDRRKAKSQRERRAAAGAVSRETYLEKNNASRTKPWERYGLGRTQYYARKKRGTLPNLPES